LEFAHNLNSGQLNPAYHQLDNLILFSSKQSIILYNSLLGRIDDWNRLISLYSITLPHAQPVTGLQFHRDGGLFTSSALDEIKVWDVEELISVFTFHFQDRVTIHVLHDALIGTGLAKTRTIRIADLRSGASTHSLVGHKSTISALNWMPNRDYILASASFDGTLMMWDIRKANSNLYSIQIPKANILQFSDDGHSIYTSGSQGIKVWDSFHGVPLMAFPCPLGMENKQSVAINMIIDDMGFVFHPFDNQIHVFNPDGEIIHVLTGHMNSCFSLGFDRDRKRLFSVSERDGILMWDYQPKKRRPTPLLGTMNNPLPITIGNEELDLFGENWD
jgi:WD40 repeat protein